MQIHNVDYVENVYICGNFSLFYVIIVSYLKIICIMKVSEMIECFFENEDLSCTCECDCTSCVFNPNYVEKEV